MKHEHKIGIKAFQHNIYENLQKIDKDTTLVITNRGQEMYTVSAASFNVGTADPALFVPTATLLSDMPKKKRIKHENDR
jgi:hypothetical protein